MTNLILSDLDFHQKAYNCLGLVPSPITFVTIVAITIAQLLSLAR